MKIDVKKDVMITFEPEDELDFFYLGVMSERYPPNTCIWDRGKISRMEIWNTDFLLALVRKKK